MFNYVTGVCYDPGTNYLAVWQLYPLEQVVFVFVARVSRFEAERTSVDLQDVLYDLRQVRFVDPRSLVDAVTSVKPYAFSRNSIERDVRCFNINFRTSSLLLFIKIWFDEDVR